MISDLTKLVKAIPTTAVAPSFTSSDRSLFEMTSAALISQGALLTNMASLLQRGLSATVRSNARAMAEGEKDKGKGVAMEAEAEIPPPGPTIDLGGDEEKEEEEEEEEEEDSFHISQKDQGDDDDDDDDEGPGHFGRSGRVVSSAAQPSQGGIKGSEPLKVLKPLETNREMKGRKDQLRGSISLLP